jgi:uridine kinase
VRKDKSKPMLVGVCGGSGSGKTTIVNMLTDHCNPGEILVLHMDHYYKDFSLLQPHDRDRVNFDDPSSFDLGLLHDQVSALLNNKSIERPTYDFATHTRTKQTVRLDPAPTLVIDGILSLHHAPLRKLYNLTVFVDVPDDLRFIRRMQRDIRERGRNIESVVSQYLATVKPMHDLYVEPQRSLADVIIGWRDRSEKAVRMLAKAIAI